jgi:ankyrin repeat protein
MADFVSILYLASIATPAAALFIAGDDLSHLAKSSDTLSASAMKRGKALAALLADNKVTDGIEGVDNPPSLDPKTAGMRGGGLKDLLKAAAKKEETAPAPEIPSGVISADDTGVPTEDAAKKEAEDKATAEKKGAEDAAAKLDAVAPVTPATAPVSNPTTPAPAPAPPTVAPIKAPTQPETPTTNPGSVSQPTTPAASVTTTAVSAPAPVIPVPTKPRISDSSIFLDYPVGSTKYTPLLWALYSDDADAEQLAIRLIQKGANVNPKVDKKEGSVIHVALKKEKYTAAALLIQNVPKDGLLNIRDEGGFTPLMLAAVSPEAEDSVSALLKHKVNVNIRSLDKKSVLTIACENQNPTLAVRLIRAFKANVIPSAVAAALLNQLAEVVEVMTTTLGPEAMKGMVSNEMLKAMVEKEQAPNADTEGQLTTILNTLLQRHGVDVQKVADATSSKTPDTVKAVNDKAMEILTAATEARQKAEADAKAAEEEHARVEKEASNAAKEAEVAKAAEEGRKIKEKLDQEAAQKDLLERRSRLNASLADEWSITDVPEDQAAKSQAKATAEAAAVDAADKRKVEDEIEAAEVARRSEEEAKRLEAEGKLAEARVERDKAAAEAEKSKRDAEVLQILANNANEVNAESRVLKLIKDGSRVRLVDPETQTTALMFAARGLMTRVVKEILNRLASPGFQREEANKVNAKGQRALDLVVSLPAGVQTRAQYESMILKKGIDAELQVQKELQQALAESAPKRAKFEAMDRAVANAVETNKEEAKLHELERIEAIAEPSNAKQRAQFVNPMFTRRARGQGRKTRKRGGQSDRAAIMKMLQAITDKTPVLPVGPGLQLPVPEKPVDQAALQAEANKIHLQEVAYQVNEQQRVAKENEERNRAPFTFLPPPAPMAAVPPPPVAAVPPPPVAAVPPAPKKGLSEAELNAAAQKKADEMYKKYEAEKAAKDAEAAARAHAAADTSLQHEKELREKIKKEHGIGGRSRRRKARKSTFRRHRK